MTPEAWKGWPSREALCRERRPRKRLAVAVRLLVVGVLLWSTFARRDIGGWALAVAMACLVAVAVCGWAFYRTTLRHQLWPSLGLLSLLLSAGVIAQQTGFEVPALVLWCACAVTGLERLPLAAAAPTTLVFLAGYALVNDDAWLTTAITTAGLALAGYVLRLDAEARGTAQRLLDRERAARVAEAESATLAERARIAREIHDVLAHSLSAQLVHLEAARIRIEQEAPSPFRDQILERVVAARAMAGGGLAETRQALSALRGDMTPVGDYLRELAALEHAEIEVCGTPRPLPAEASQAVRRVAQEALTNARKHASGAQVSMRLTYGEDDVTLDVRDTGGGGRPHGTGHRSVPAGLGGSGSGYGLLGMRERAELLGGTLRAGSEGAEEEGFTVCLRVPA